jgi:peptidoglycan/LPS O-acetylase OafA/YrhL
MTDPSVADSRSGSRENVALSVALLAVVLYVVAMAVAGDDDSDYGWLWPVAAVVGGGAAIAGWRAGAPRPRGKALAATVLGALVFVVIVGWIVVAAITGDL